MIFITNIFIFFFLWNFCLSLFCLHNKTGKHYEGMANITISGKICLPWEVAKERYSLENLKIKNYKENFCRNPNGSTSVWCYIGKDEMENCYIPLCPTNPEANYCIVIPEIDFKVCPTLFSKLRTFQLKKLFFCCLSTNTDIINILPKDNCLIVVIQASVLQEHFATCPEGFYSQSVTQNILESNVIYKCCKLENPIVNFVQKIINSIIEKNIDGAVVASLSLKGLQCEAPVGLLSYSVEYHEMDIVTQGFLPSKTTICYFHLKNKTPAIHTYSQLGFMSFKECPSGFIESKEGMNSLEYGSMELKFCWPTKIFDLSSVGNLCLNSKSILNNLSICPENFQAYDIVSALIKAPYFRICCPSQKRNSNFSLDSFGITDNTSVAFITTSGNCPSYFTNVSINVFSVKSKIKWKPLSYNSKMQVIRESISLPSVSLCAYELHKNEFGYKMVGAACPEGMFNGKVTVKLKSNVKGELLEKEYTIEFCVGNTVYTTTSFPEGKYCIYKISSNCPIGFFPESLTEKRIIVSKKNLVPDYQNAALCCRKDKDNNGTLNSFPFVYRNKTVSFGILLFNNFDLCPNIEGFISYLDFDIDGPFCSFRSEEEHYRWRNEIIWPDSVDRYPKKNKLINATVTLPWKSLHNLSYLSSVIHKYPRGDFCILSFGKCLSTKGMNFIVKYPVDGFFICCSLELGSSLESPLKNSLSANLAENYLIGYLAAYGKCPYVDQTVFSLQSIVHDTFKIEDNHFNSDYRKRLKKIGILPGVTSSKRSIQVDFPFCIFQVKRITEYKDISNKRRYAEFMKPLFSFCPKGYKEIQRKIATDTEGNNDPLSTYFINKNLLSVCTPINMDLKSQMLQWPPSLCLISSIQCLKGNNNVNLSLNIGQSGTEPFYMCCPKTTSDLYLKETFPEQFALPLNPEKKVCSAMRDHSSMIFKIELSQPFHSKYLSFCFYYSPLSIASWPSGSYFTISYNQKCPFGFQLMDTNSSSLCRRENSTPSFSQFPEGNYCILTFINELCPPTVSWRFRIDLGVLGHTDLNLCCSIGKSLIFNIPITKGAVFSFLSIDKCSFIPGTRLKQMPFLSFRRIIKCVYMDEDCDTWNFEICLHYSKPKETKTDISDFLVKRQNIIISLLLSILAVIALLGSAFILHNRNRLNKINATKTSNMRLSAIYTNIDYTSKPEEDGQEEDTPSVAYSTIS